MTNTKFFLPFILHDFKKGSVRMIHDQEKGSVRLSSKYGLHTNAMEDTKGS